MRRPLGGSSVAAILLLVGGQALTQDEKLPDYASKPLAKWIEALKDKENPQLLLQARNALGPEGPYARVAIPALIDALKDEQLSIRSVASATLADYGPSVVPVLQRALKSPEATIRAGIIQALGAVRPRATEAIPALIDALKDSNPNVRAAAGWSLASIGRAAHKAVPSLAVALQDKHDEVRESAAQALSEMGRKAEPAIPVLIEALKDKDQHVREPAAWAIRTIGPAAKPAVPALIEAIRNKENGISRSGFAQALGAIGPAAKEAVPALVEALAEGDDLLLRWAAFALGEIGPDARAAVPALIKAAKEGPLVERGTVIRALGRIGPAAKAAVATLMDALDTQKSFSVRFAAAQALGGIGIEAKAAVPKLVAMVRDQRANPQLREAAAFAVMKIDPEFAARERVDTAYLSVRLGKIPSVELVARRAVTEGQKKRIKGLIAKLAEIESPDFGMSATLTGHSFAPLPDREHWQTGLLTDHRLSPSDALRSLVEIGPDAFPFLLEALEDKTPTKLKVTHNFGIGGMWLSAELERNPLSAVETRALSKPLTKADDEDDANEALLRSYTVKVGDICFVAIGQIVGRQYLAVRYQPTAIIVINSPVQTKELRERVRAIWSSKDAARTLLDSLLLDYATQGIFNGESLDGWGEGSDRQIEAAVRLLYYFPKEIVPLLAARLRSLDVRKPGPADDAWMKRDVKNGVRTIDFIKAVSWCREPGIREALADLVKHTDDPALTKLLTASKQ